MRLYEYVSEISNKRSLFRMRWVSLKDFMLFISRAELITDFLIDKDVHLIFNLCIAIQVDELTEDRHMRMNFIEFVEALARLAEKISPVPLGEKWASWYLPRK